MSYATEHPVRCARLKDLNCQAAHPASRWESIRAQEAGWFRSKAEEESYCPDHVPDWVPAWREKQAARRFEVKAAFAKLPVTLSCAGCDLARTAENEDPDVLRELRSVGWEHARESGHAVTVKTAQEWTVGPET